MLTEGNISDKELLVFFFFSVSFRLVFLSLIIALKGKAVLEAIKDLEELNITFPSYITKTSYI